MASQKLQKVQESAKQAPTREVGSQDAPTQISTHARHIGAMAHDVGISGGWLNGPPKDGRLEALAMGPPFPSGVLVLDLFRPFSDAAGKWKVEIFEERPDGEVLLATFEGNTKHRGYDLSVTKWKAEKASLPEGRRVLLPVLFTRAFHYQGEVLDLLGPDLQTVYYVPMEGHQDYASESWTLFVKCHTDDGLVHDDDTDSVHVWVDWPRGSIVYPMLGSPALVSDKDHKMEVLVALDRRLPDGAERFALKTMLRLFPWGKESARQDAIKKRTFKLADDDSKVDFREHRFLDVAAEAKDAKGRAEKDDEGFKLRLGMMEYFTTAEIEFAHGAQFEHREVIASRAGVYHVPDPPRQGARVPLPVLCFGRNAAGGVTEATAPEVGATFLYKVRFEIGEGKGLYDLVWMTPDDFTAANTAVGTGSKDAIRPLQDQRLRDALHSMSIKAHPDAAVNARVPYKYDGKKTGDDAWKPTRNQPDTLDKAFALVRSHHPVYVFDGGSPFKLGHLTDLHLDVRLDVMAQNPMRIIPDEAGVSDVATPPVGELINNYNATFTELAHAVLDGADALVLTGDLIDYNRGFALSAQGDVDERFCWKLGLSAGEQGSRYKRERNWMHFFQILLGLYDQKKKPIFTTLGNHDYRPNPYSVYPGFSMPWGSFSVYPTIGGDLNLTLLELASCYGPQFASVTMNGTQIRADVDSLDNFAWSVRWYHTAISCWKDLAVTAGDVSLLLMDWDVEESCISVHKGSALPRAKLFMTKAQMKIYERWRESAPPCKVMACHPTLACNGAAIEVTNSMARAKPYPLDDINHGTMGARTILGSDAWWACGIREGIAKDIADGKVKMIITGHSHMDGMYLPLEGGKEVQMLWPKNPAWGKEMAFPSGSIAGMIVVTNCGGPMGEFTEKSWTRRSRPAGSVFELAPSSIHMKHVASKRPQTRPRRAVLDCERVRVQDGHFYVEMTLDEIIGRTYEQAGGLVAGCFYYLVDPEDPSESSPINVVKQLALVVNTADKGWRREISTLEPWGRITVPDPNGGGWVTAVQLGFRFPRVHVGHALGDNYEMYMLLRYGTGPADDWVIPVRTDQIMPQPKNDAEDQPRRDDPPEPIKMAFLDTKFPRFDWRSPRWSTQAKKG